MGCLTVTFTRIGGVDAAYERKGGIGASYNRIGGIDAYFAQVCEVPSSKKRLRDADGRLVLTSKNETIILNEE